MSLFRRLFGLQRKLTVGEIAMAKLVFADAIDYSKVKMHRGGYTWFLGFQHKHTAVTPNGEMYFPEAHFQEDFSVLDSRLQAWFMHEMTHVWQYQLGYRLKFVRALRPKMSYDYTLELGKKFCDFNMEAQGNMVSDYFLIMFKNENQRLANQKYAGSLDFAAQLHTTMSDFLATPKSKAHLPKTTR